VLGVLLGVLAFSGHFPSVCPSMLGVMLGVLGVWGSFEHGVIAFSCKLWPKACKAFQKRVFENVLLYLHIRGKECKT